MPKAFSAIARDCLKAVHDTERIVAIRLTFPRKSHETDDLRPLYDEFNAQDPERFREWQAIEKQDKLGPDDLKVIQYQVYDFLKQRVEWDSHAALASAFADFRRLMQRDLFWN